jgi:hypothetical protein
MIRRPLMLRLSPPPTPYGLEGLVWREHVVWAGDGPWSLDGPDFWAMLDQLDEDEVLPHRLVVALTDGSWWETAWQDGEYGWRHRQLGERGDEPLTGLRDGGPISAAQRNDDEEERPSVIEALKAEIAHLTEQFADPLVLREALHQLRLRFTPREWPSPAPTPSDFKIYDRETLVWGQCLLDEAIAAADDGARPTPDRSSDWMPLLGADNVEEDFRAQRRALPRADYIAWLRDVRRRTLKNRELSFPWIEKMVALIDEEMRAEGEKPPRRSPIRDELPPQIAWRAAT